jgi:ankyrin repeat protein
MEKPAQRLMQAIARNDLGEVEAVLPQVAGNENTLEQALLRILKDAQLPVLDRLLATRPHPEVLKAPLAQAITKGTEALVQRLLAAGAPYEASHAYSRQPPPLTLAAKRGHAGIVQALLAAGAHPEGGALGVFRKDLPLLVAITRGHTEVVGALVRAGARLDVPVDSKGRRPLDLARSKGHADIVALLEAAGAQGQTEGDRELAKAAKAGAVARVAALVSQANPEARKKALEVAIKAVQPGAVAALVRAGLTQTMLDQALGQVLWTGRCDLRVATVLLDAGANPNARPVPAYGEAKHPLLGLALGSCNEAERKRRPDFIRLLRARGAVVTAEVRKAPDAYPKLLAVLDEPVRAPTVPPLDEAAPGKKKEATPYARARQLLQPLARPAFTFSWHGPVRESGPADSKRGGLPGLLEGERWPCTPSGQPMAFVLQLDLDEVRAARGLELGSGVLQLFYSVEESPWGPFSPEGLVRIVPKQALRAPGEVPAKLGREPSRYSSGLLPERPLRVQEAASRCAEDFPFREAGTKKWHRYALDLPVDSDALARLCRDGNKVGGYPKWIQDPEYPADPKTGRELSRLLLQLEPDPVGELTWGDNGYLYVLQCPEEPTLVTFVMQSG